MNKGFIAALGFLCSYLVNHRFIGGCGMSVSETCQRKGCKEKAYVKQGRQMLCVLHYRYGQMKATAKRRGLSVPTNEQLINITPHDMRCRDCKRVMNWLAKENQTLVASLQHYRDGTFGLVCRSCNTRHAYMPGDSFILDKDENKYCPKCMESKDRSEFYCDNSRSGELKTKSHCKKCSDKATQEWREMNREKNIDYQKKYRSENKVKNNYGNKS